MQNITIGQKKIMHTVKDELLPSIDNLKKLLVEIQSYRISIDLYSKKLNDFEKRYSNVSKNFYDVVQKLETPDILFKDIESDNQNMIDYFQFQGAFKQNIFEGISYSEIIDRTLDRKMGAIINNRTLITSVVAIIVSIISLSF